MTETGTIVSEQLTAVDRSELQECEKVIERGLRTFVDVGTALMRIRDKRLYREWYGTFEAYCQDRWGMARNYANKLIMASEVVGNLGTIVPTLPANESQARPLTSLAPDQQSEVWQRAVETAPNGRVTGAHVQATVEAYQNGNGNYEYEPPTPHVARNSGDNEWYTPQEFIDAARDVMGQIDLDPASTPEANTIVGASEFYTSDLDGLEQDWYGRVWMNPPYARDLIGKFTGKLIYHYCNGDVEEAIVLVNNATETGWFTGMIKFAPAVVFPDSRIKFWKPSGERGGPLQGQAIIYFGNNTRGFLDAFGPFGWGAVIDG